MIINESNDEKWEKFISGGRIVDYLEYKGIKCNKSPYTEGSFGYADHNQGSGYIFKECWRK